MRWRSIAFLSVAINVVLVVAWGLSGRRLTTSVAVSGGVVETNADQSRPKMVVRRQYFTWHEVESKDYPTYIANLRDIGCPEQTIRDIIIADVNGLFAQRRATELLTGGQQWWRSEQDPEVIRVAAEKSKLLEEERRALLTKLLGPSWESGDLVSLPRPSHAGVLLDGPILGALSAETKQQVEDVHERSEERMQAYMDAQRRAGKNPSATELAKLRAQTRIELSQILPPTQVEEFLLRYSQNANELRAQFGQLEYFNPSPDEFRAVFRATDNLDEQIAALADATDANSLRQKKALEDQREAAIKNALGPKRYDEYRLFQDPLYRDAYAKALDAGTPDAVRAYYAIELAAAGEQDRIRSDTNMTDSQKSIELKRLELEQLKASVIASGQPATPEPSEQQSSSPQRTHQMRPGDTLAVVSIMYNVPIEAIRDANRGVNVNTLKPGDVLIIPPWPNPQAQ